jgi:uncharacterized protein (TIGR02594 family)
MTLSRRALFAAASASLAAAPDLAKASGRRGPRLTVPPQAPDHRLPFGGDFVGPDNDPDLAAKSLAAQIGSGSSAHGEVATAFRLLFGVAGKKTPLEAARYFASLTERNEDDEPYVREWANRANPLITGFFSMTHTLPSDGDETPWCAAFVSFCLYATGRPTRYSALARSYVGYGGGATPDPRPGDLAVFKRGKNSGHVAFFTGWETNHAGKRTGRCLVLGGNQGAIDGVRDAIVEKPRGLEQLIGFYSVDNETSGTAS